MRILLVAINAKYIHSNLAIYSLKKYADVDDINIELAEYTINQQFFDILKDIYYRKADVIAFSCYIWNIDIIKVLIKELKKINKNIKIWLGGPEVSYDAIKMMKKYNEIDLIIRGEGEEVFKNLLMSIKNNDSFDNISGITYYDENNNIIENPLCCQMDMNKIPFVYENLKDFENKIIYYETSRGCPFSCSYCLSSIDKKVRFRDFSLVENELRFFLDNKVKQVKFVDRTFNCNKKHSMQIWNYINDNDNGVTNFHFEISADLLGDDELNLFKKMRPALIQLEIGVQSTNDITIKEIDRTMKLDRLKSIVKEINSFGNIHQHLDLIVGLPFEDYKTFINSFNEIYELRPNQLQMGFLKVLKGSKMYQKREEYGIKYTENAPYEVLSTNWITFDEIIHLKEIEEMLEVYYNSNQFVNTLEYLMNFFEKPFDFFDKIAEYYKGNNYDKVKHNRIARYNILREFCINELNLDEIALNDILLYDLYLREDIKTRPSWAIDNMLYKNIYKEFFRNDELNKKYFNSDVNSKEASKITHIEKFSINIEETIKQGKTVLEQSFILFDYKRRNPLNNDAYTVCLEELKSE